MSFEDEVYEYQDFIEEKIKNKCFLKFENNKVTCNNISIWKILWEYLCWCLAGKPHNENKRI
tara:strand:- start:317 stop:502 length:186 start_codon:yes stop_codon:yes gene_type:complete